MGALELGEIDAMAVQAEAEHEEGHRETGQHDAPAPVVQRGFADTGCGNSSIEQSVKGTV